MANEKRLIDANAFEKHHCDGCPYRKKGSCTDGDPICATIDDLRDAPTVDAVEVVRCKDCKHINRAMREPEGCSLCDFHSCDRIGHERYLYVEDDDFCSMGERRDNERKAD